MAVATEAKTSTRDLILDATDRLMARYGFRKMTMDDVAREAGVSKRTIYVHFQSKEDVGLSSIGRVVARVHQELEAISKEPIPMEAKLRKMLERRVMGRIEQVQEYAHSLDELFEVVRPAYMVRRALSFEFERDTISNVLGGNPGLAESLLLATNAFLPYSLSIRELGSPDAIAIRLSTMIDTLLHGALNQSR